MTEPRTYVILSQVYVPDPAAAGQHLADAAAELVRRGHRVVVLTADRGYDDPSQRYARRERIDGVEVIRLPWSSFGKRSLLARVLGGVSFLAQAVARGLFVRRVDAVLVTSSPPLSTASGLLVASLRRTELVYWAMDLNPDQLVALGLLRPHSLLGRALGAFTGALLRRADRIVALDRYIAERLTARGAAEGKVRVIPPWPHEEVSTPVPHHDNPFRAELGLGDRFVVMYSGNHGRSNPLGTVIDAARRLAHEPDIVFVFVGGGERKHEVDRLDLPNVLSLPYQPASRLRFSLSAADVHLVTMGDGLSGVVHPCKLYGALAVGRPVLYVGPDPSPLADVVREHDVGWSVRHGDDARLARLVVELAADRARVAGAGARAMEAARRTYAREALCGRLCEAVLESVAPPVDRR